MEEGCLCKWLFLNSHLGIAYSLGLSLGSQHIREQERLKREEEETRKGREHLDALLDQSGYILETQHLDLSRGTRSRSRSSSVSASLRDLDDEHEGETDAEENVTSDDDTSTAGDNGHPEQEGDPSDGAESASVLVDGEDSDDEDEGEEGENSATALLGLNMTLDDPSEKVDGDVDMMEVEAAGIDEVSVVPFEDGSSLHSEPLATPTSEPLPGSPPSLTHAPHPIVLSPPSHSSPSSAPSAAHPFTEAIISVDGTFHPECKTPTAQSQITDMHTDSLVIDGDHISPEEPLTRDKPSSNGDATISESQGLTPIVQPATTETKTVSSTHLEDVPPLQEVDDVASDIEEEIEDARIPRYLKPYAVAPVEWDSNAVVKPPALLRGVLRPYQQAGLEWLASIHARNLNCILADEMGLGYVTPSFPLITADWCPVKRFKLSHCWHIWRAIGVYGVRT